MSDKPWEVFKNAPFQITTANLINKRLTALEAENKTMRETFEDRLAELESLANNAARVAELSHANVEKVFKQIQEESVEDDFQDQIDHLSNRLSPLEIAHTKTPTRIEDLEKGQTQLTTRVSAIVAGDNSKVEVLTGRLNEHEERTAKHPEYIQYIFSQLTAHTERMDTLNEFRCDERGRVDRLDSNLRDSVDTINEAMNANVSTLANRLTEIEAALNAEPAEEKCCGNCASSGNWACTVYTAFEAQNRCFGNGYAKWTPKVKDPPESPLTMDKDGCDGCWFNKDNNCLCSVPCTNYQEYSPNGKPKSLTPELDAVTEMFKGPCDPERERLEREVIDAAKAWFAVGDTARALKDTWIAVGKLTAHEEGKCPT